MRTLFVAGLALFGIVQSGSLAPAAINDDLALFQTALEQLHPEFGSESARRNLTAFVDRVRTQVPSPANSLDLFRKLVESAELIQDGHTSLSPPAELQKTIATWRVLPLRVYVTGDDAMWVTRAAAEAVPAGSRVLAIDDVPVADLIRNASRAEPRDGLNRTRLRWALSLPYRFNQIHAALSGERERYRVRVQRPGGSVAESVDLAGLTVQALRGTDPPAPRALGVRSEQNGLVAVLTIPSFNEELATRLRDLMQGIVSSGAKALVIDLRDNGGGRDELGKQLFAHLAEKPFGYYRALTVRARPEHPVSAGIRPMLERLQTNADGSRQVSSPNLGPQQPEAVRFAGPVVLLLNGGSFSATTEFAAVARASGRVSIVGEESGGGFCTNNSGSSSHVMLPNSQIRLTVPLVHYEVDVPCDGARRGVMPHETVMPTIDDLIAGRDPQMARAIARATSGKSE